MGVGGLYIHGAINLPPERVIKGKKQPEYARLFSQKNLP